MSLALDGSLDDVGVIGIRNKGNDKVVCSDLAFQVCDRVDIEGDSLGGRETLGKGLGTCKSTASYRS